MKKVQTVLGSVDPEELGMTLTHIHLWFSEPTDDPGNVLDDIDLSVQEMLYYKEAGGRAVVDGNIWTDRAEQLVEISRRSGLHVIATAGLRWLNTFEKEKNLFEKKYPPPPILDMALEDMVAQVVREVTDGIDGTDVKAGVLKTGAPYNYINPYSERALRAIGRAQAQTGVPIFLHTSKGTMALEQLEILQEEGADLGKVALGHIDRNPDPWYYEQIVKMGANLIFDHISKAKYWPDSMHVDNMRRLVDAGYADRITLSLDYGHYRDLRAYGGGVGYAWVLERFVPRLRDQGFKEETINQFLVENPARYLAF
jgi:phosphotriesterase-related protein